MNQLCFVLFTLIIKRMSGDNGVLTDPTHARHPATFLASNSILGTLFPSENNVFYSVMKKLKVNRVCVITSLIL